jgi:N-acetylneuraminic acid mutarotase
MKTICYTFLLCILFSNSYGQSWQKVLPVMPGGNRDAAVSFSIGNKIYSGGGSGYGNRDFYEFDLATKKWTKKANIPGVDTNRGFAASFSINGKGYVGMGSNGVIAPSCKSDLWKYDPAADSWTRKADYPGGMRDGVGVFVLGNKAYIGGGLDSTFYGDLGFYSYDPSTDYWTQLSDLPVGPIIFPSMFTIGNYGYMTCGGIGVSGTTDLWRYDPAGDAWDKMASFPGTKRQACANFVLNGKGYVGLGQDTYTVVFKDMYSYNPQSNNWNKETDFTGNGRAWVTSISVGDTVYVGNGSNFAGGYVNPMSDWWSFTPASASVNDLSNNNSDIHAYPQPAISELHLAGLKNNDTYQAKMFDALGREISSSIITGGNPEIHISNLSAGVYTILLISKDERLSLPIIKE